MPPLRAFGRISAFPEFRQLRNPKIRQLKQLHGQRLRLDSLPIARMLRAIRTDPDKRPNGEGGASVVRPDQNVERGRNG